MNTIRDYIDELSILKNRLVDNLNTRNIDATTDEKFNTLIPKVETITTPATTTQYFTDFSFAYCDLPEEEVTNLFNLIYLTNPSTDLRGKFSNIPNLKHLNLSALNINTLDNSDSTTFSETPLETLDLSNTTINSHTIFCASIYSSSNQNQPTSNTTLPYKTLKELNLSNVKYNANYLGLYGLIELENIIGLDTVEFSTPMTQFSCICCYNRKLKSIDLSNITLSDNCKYFNYCFWNCGELESIIPPKNFPKKPKGIVSMFANCPKLPWEDIANFLNWDEIDLSGLEVAEFYQGGMFSINLYNYTTQEEYETNGCLKDYPRAIDYIKWNEDWVLKWSPKIFGGNHIKTLDFSDLTLYIMNGLQGLQGISLDWIKGPNGHSANSPDVQFDNLLLKNSVLTIKQFSGNVSPNAVAYFKNPSHIEFDNTTFIMETSSLGNFLNYQWLDNYDLSNLTLHFPDTYAHNYFTFESCVYYSKVEEGAIFKLPKLTGNVPRIDSIVIASGSKNFSEVDLSTVSFKNYQNISGLQLPIATKVYIGEDYGKGFKNANVNAYKFDWLKNNTAIQKECILDIFNKVYDLNLTYNVANGGTLYTQQIDLHADVIAQLTPEEIAIVTNKGWTLL